MESESAQFPVLTLSCFGGIPTISIGITFFVFSCDYTETTIIHCAYHHLFNSSNKKLRQNHFSHSKMSEKQLIAHLQERFHPDLLRYIGTFIPYPVIYRCRHPIYNRICALRLQLRRVKEEMEMIGQSRQDILENCFEPSRLRECLSWDNVSYELSVNSLRRQIIHLNREFTKSHKNRQICVKKQ
jgi:phosphoenolpyruvate synthase/pyruvate phosphate dikinase